MYNVYLYISIIYAHYCPRMSVIISTFLGLVRSCTKKLNGYMYVSFHFKQQVVCLCFKIIVHKRIQENTCAYHMQNSDSKVNCKGQF